MKTHSVTASQTCLATDRHTNKQTQQTNRLAILKEDSQVTNSTDQQTCDPQRGFATNEKSLSRVKLVNWIFYPKVIWWRRTDGDGWMSTLEWTRTDEHGRMDMDGWTRTDGHGRMDGHGRVDMEEWTRTYGQGQVDMDGWTRTEGHGRNDTDWRTNVENLTLRGPKKGPKPKFFEWYHIRYVKAIHQQNLNVLAWIVKKLTFLKLWGPKWPQTKKSYLIWYQVPQRYTQPKSEGFSLNNPKV